MSTVPNWGFHLTTETPGSVKMADDAKTLIDCFHRDLISFISIARYHRVDFLPMIWDDSHSSLGKGATGKVMQSVINLQRSYAFKLFKKADKDTMFRELISEVVLLNQRAIKMHPNIVDLEGISFEVDHETEEVWPVLVFKKAQFGSLRMFMDSGGGRDITFNSKVKLCSQIGSAIMTMHDMDVIHGDIKPENILVFGDKIDKLTPKVTDFGYSCIGAQDKSLVYLPVTWYWCAPEYHARAIELRRAKMMDIYSFAMVCLWVLFSEEFSRLRADLEETKDRRKFQQSAMDLASESERLGCELRLFFDLALREDWQTREDDLRKLLTLLGEDIWQPAPDRPHSLADFGSSLEDTKDPERFRALMEKIVHTMHGSGKELRIAERYLNQSNFEAKDDTEKWITSGIESFHKNMLPSFVQAVDTRYTMMHDCFNLSAVIYQLQHHHYRIRVHIAECLERKATENSCVECSAQAAFQVAFCYSIGFGVAADARKVQHWLALSTEDSTALEAYIDRLKRMIPVELQLGTYAGIARLGDFRIDFNSLYHNREGLKRAEEYCEREIHDLEECIGQDHLLTFEMRGALQGMKDALGKSKEAEAIGWSLKRVSEMRLGKGHPFTLTVILELAKRYLEQNKWKEAKELALEVKGLAEAIPDPSHPIRMQALQTLSQIYTGSGDYDMGVDLTSKLLRIREGVYGPDPIAEATEISNSGWMLMKRGNLEEAEHMLLYAAEEFKRLRGPNDYLTIMTMRNLALTYRNQGRMLEAENMQVGLKALAEVALGPERRETFDVMFDLARTYEMQARLGEAADLYVSLRGGRERVLGRNHEETIFTSSRLVDIYNQLGMLDKAEEALVHIKEAKEETLGYSDPETLDAVRELGLILFRQGKLYQAEESMMELRLTLEGLKGSEHMETLGTMSNVGQVYRCQGRFVEAEQLLSETMDKMKRVLGEGHQFTMNTTRALIQTYLDQGKFLNVFGLQNHGRQSTHGSILYPTSSIQNRNPHTTDTEDEQALLDQAVAISLRSNSNTPEIDEEEMIRQALELSLKDDSDSA